MNLRNSHLSYAVTWYGIALALIGVYLAFHHQAGRLSFGRGHEDDGGRSSEIYQHEGNDGPLGYEEALLSGLARDGGLYLPTIIHAFLLRKLRRCVAFHIRNLPVSSWHASPMARLRLNELTAMADDAYAGFDDPAVAPLRHLTGDIHVLELFHGPTIAFKDYAMQFLAHAFDRALQRSSQQAVILGATSGDTGQLRLRPFRSVMRLTCSFCFPKVACHPFSNAR